MTYDEIMDHIKRNDQLAVYFDIEPVECRLGYGKAVMPLEKRHLNGVSTAHGGAIFTLADIALALAALSHGDFAVTLSLNISYLKPGRLGPLTAEAREIGASGRISHYEVSVRDAEGEMVAHCNGMAYHKKGSFPPEAGQSPE